MPTGAPCPYRALIRYITRTFERGLRIDAEVNLSSGPEEQQSLAKNVDIGLSYLAQSEVVDYTPDEEQKIRWKIDLCLLPIVRLQHCSNRHMYMLMICSSCP